MEVKNWIIASLVGLPIGTFYLIYLHISDISWMASASVIVWFIIALVTFFYLELRKYALPKKARLNND